MVGNCSIVNSKFSVKSSWGKYHVASAKEIIEHKIFSVGEILFSDDSKFTYIESNNIEEAIISVLLVSNVVDKIFLSRGDDNNAFHVSSILTVYDKQSRFALYNQEKEVIGAFLNLPFTFDFNILDSEDIPSILRAGAKLIYSRK